MSSFSLYYTWLNDLRLYNCMILAMIIIMFIYSGIVVIWDPWILIWHPPLSFVPFALHRAQMTLLDGKSKSSGFKWQQCLQNEHYFYIKMIQDLFLFYNKRLSFWYTNENIWFYTSGQWGQCINIYNHSQNIWGKL